MNCRDGRKRLEVVPLAVVAGRASLRGTNLKFAEGGRHESRGEGSENGGLHDDGRRGTAAICSVRVLTAVGGASTHNRGRVESDYKNWGASCISQPRPLVAAAPFVTRMIIPWPPVPGFRSWRIFGEVEGP